MLHKRAKGAEKPMKYGNNNYRRSNDRLGFMSCNTVVATHNKMNKERFICLRDNFCKDFPNPNNRNCGGIQHLQEVESYSLHTSL